MKLEDRTKVVPHLTSVWVRGQDVQVTPKAIKSLYLEEPIPPHPILRQKIADKANQFHRVARIIAQCQPQWEVSKGLIHRHDLNFDACMWSNLVFSRLMPSRNTLEVPIEVAILLACIMKHVHINVGEIIDDQFR
ncbi:hypothetical protein HAX54_007700 [Datura stramonium]|uniref:Putative plant transposon protein domain-containing protein n=1 Tax=Datura stramonium TaxID=4076 RepID=A0ABS8TDK0_DATST|nr:hypothetical protein [Datura stramonium]